MRSAPTGLFSAQIKGFLKGSVLKVGHFFIGVVQHLTNGGIRMNDTCHICGESDNLVPVTIKDETIYLCSECKEAHLKQCSQCDDFFIDTENDYAVSRDGEIYCEFCRDEYLTYCEHCDEYSNSEDFVHLVDTDK